MDWNLLSAINLLIIWQAPQAGSMRRILCSDWLPERARWSDTVCPGLPVSFPLIKFRQSSSDKLFCAKVKRLFVISLSLSPGQTDSQVVVSWNLGSTCDSVWPGLACTCVELRWLAITLVNIKFARKSMEVFYRLATQRK